MLKIFISMVFAVTAICQTSVSFAEETGAVELVFWNSVKDSRDPNELQAYLNKYPKGQFVELAVIRKQNLERLKSSPAATGANGMYQSAKVTHAATTPVTSATGEDPRFDQYIDAVRAALNAKSRPDIRSVLPVLLPVKSDLSARKVANISETIFRDAFPSAAAISMGPTGSVVLGDARFSFTGTSDTTALADCESKRLKIDATLPKCEIFFRSRVLEPKVLINMAEKSRGPDFDKWIKGMDESVAKWERYVASQIR